VWPLDERIQGEAPPFDPRPADRTDPIGEREGGEADVLDRLVEDRLLMGEPVPAAMHDLGCIVHNPTAALTGERAIKRAVPELLS
jgi:hypothetical protein